GQAHPGQSVEHALACGAGGTQRHEAHDEVRLAEVAQAPGQTGDDGHEAHAVEQGQPVRVRVQAGGSVGVLRLDAEDGDRVIHVQDREDRHQDQGDEHDAALHRVRVGHSEEATDKGVDHGHAGDYGDADRVR